MGFCAKHRFVIPGSHTTQTRVKAVIYHTYHLQICDTASALKLGAFLAYDEHHGMHVFSLSQVAHLAYHQHGIDYESDHIISLLAHTAYTQLYVQGWCDKIALHSFYHNPNVATPVPELSHV